MSNLFHTFFKFDTFDSQVPSLLNTNRLSTLEQDGRFYFVQYLQYRREGDHLYYREESVLVDRLYYLEVANSALDDRERRRRFFALLGKRRFGVNENRYECYTMNRCDDMSVLVKAAKEALAHQEIPKIRFEKKDISLNQYEVVLFTCNEKNYLLMEQKNISQERVVEKGFILDLNRDDTLRFNAIRSSEFKIEFLYNKIGKHYFKSLHQHSVQCDRYLKPKSEVFKFTACKLNDIAALFIQHSDDIELFLDQNNPEIDKAVFSFVSRMLAFLSSQGARVEVVFIADALEKLIARFIPYAFFKYVVNCFEILHAAMQDEKAVEMLLHVNELREQDSAYIIESLCEWHDSFYGRDIQLLQSRTLDMVSAFSYYINTHLKADQEEPSTAISKTIPELHLEFSMNSHRKMISAAEYFSEIELDWELMEELEDLEHEIELIEFAMSLNHSSKRALINYFIGFSRVLNNFLEFKGLSDSIILLNEKLESFDLSRDSSMLMMMIKPVLSDLRQWKQVVLVDQSAEDMHYMDDSFYSNIAQLEMLLSDGNNDVEDDGLEFF
ncbi:MAG: hypothetical protein JXK05_13625 [Campylobacterales bacterium]|nr:hypothetical protein [Campylobacterales bacterium]